MERIKVAQVVGNARFGGVVSCVLNFFRHVDRDRFEFHFYTYGPSPFDEEIESLGGKVFYIPNVLVPFKSVAAMRKRFREQSYDIVHAHLTTLNVVPLFAAKTAGVKVRVSHAHSTTHKTEKVYIVKCFLKAFAGMFATALAGCSRYACRWLYGKRRGDGAFVLRNAIDLKRFSRDDGKSAALRREYGLENKKVVGNIGRFEFQKNQLFLVDAFAELARRREDVALAIVGGGSLAEEIAEKIREKGIGDRARVYTEKKDVQDYFALFDVFALPSLFEGLPLVAVEAQAMGLPCLLSSEITPETSVGGEVRFLPVDATEKWTEELDVMLDVCLKYDATEVIAENGYDITRESARLESYYESLIAPARNGEKK